MCNCSAFRSRIEEMWLLSSTLQPRPRTRVPIHTHWILFNISSKTLYLQVEPKIDFMASRFHKADIETRCKWLAENKIPFCYIFSCLYRITAGQSAFTLYSYTAQNAMQLTSVRCKMLWSRDLHLAVVAGAMVEVGGARVRDGPQPSQHQTLQHPGQDHKQSGAGAKLALRPPQPRLGQRIP